uniref:Uncharacterized protein n=1 Tax=Physcomitrium patens TaxID=3218 RepID=A0A2K1JZD8_PHYPA|nr:hypothetical protein PHYPA_014014 [Physcomitrium patens]
MNNDRLDGDHLVNGIMYKRQENETFIATNAFVIDIPDVSEAKHSNPEPEGQLSEKQSGVAGLLGRRLSTLQQMLMEDTIRRSAGGVLQSWRPMQLWSRVVPQQTWNIYSVLQWTPNSQPGLFFLLDRFSWPQAWPQLCSPTTSHSRGQ